MTTPAATQPTAAPGPQAKPRVLIADDSRVVRLAIKRILGTTYDLVEVGDGASAWERVRADAEIQALITDIEMPNVDGYELICRIRGAEETRLRELPVIAITGAEDEETKQRAFACGATDFIIKPIDAIQLQARVQAYVRYDQATRDLTEKSVILEDQAIMDTVTGLSSRRYLLQRGEQDLAFAVRRGNDLSLIRVDIDHFKKLYKTHGDDVSEALLAWFGKLFFDTARTEDTVARVGGAQFAILANATNIDAATKLCQRLQEAVANQPYRHGKLTIPIVLSMGLASLVQDRRENIDDLLKLAHQRLCHAQSEGGDRVCSTILPDMQVEEAIALPVESPDDILPSLEEPAADPALTHTVTEFGLIDGVVELSVEALPDIFPSLPESVPETTYPDTLTVPELEEILSQEVLGQPAQGDKNAVFDMENASATAPEFVPMSPSDPLSIDNALHMLALGRIDTLAPLLDALLHRVQPLLDYAVQVQIHQAGQAGGRKPR